MCIVSMVHEHFDPLIPIPGTTPSTVPFTISTPSVRQFLGLSNDPVQVDIDIVEISVLIEQLKGLLADFRSAKAAAETVDKLMGQADCVDPKKVGLIERVDTLEKRLVAIELLLGKP